VKLGVCFRLLCFAFSLIAIVFGFQRVQFVCPKNGDCPVTRQSRRMCNCCRLAKCFRVGMQKSLILSDAEREARQDMVRQSREKRAQLVKKVKFMFSKGRIYFTARIFMNSKHMSLTDRKSIFSNL
jgi:hypothetical protein